MSNSVPLQTVIEYVEALSPEDQDLLLELIYNRRVEQRRREIASNAAQTLETLKTGKAKRGTVAELRADLLSQEWELWFGIVAFGVRLGELFVKTLK